MEKNYQPILGDVPVLMTVEGINSHEVCYIVYHRSALMQLLKMMRANCQIKICLGLYAVMLSKLA
jgi:hypothetical protein